MKLKEVHQEAKHCIKNNFWKLFFVALLNCLISFAFTRLSNSYDTISFQLIFMVLSYIVTVPLSYGVTVSFIKSSREESFSVFDFLSNGLKSFGRVWAVFGRTILKLIVPIIVFVVGYVAAFLLLRTAIKDIFNLQHLNYGFAIFYTSIIILAGVTIYYIIKALSYVLTNYILYDNPDLSAKEIVEESAMMMKGNKISFIILIFYIGILFVILFGICSFLITYFVNYVALLFSTVLMLAGIIILLPYTLALQVAFYNSLRSPDSKVENNKE